MTPAVPSAHITDDGYTIFAKIVPIPGISSLTVQQAIRDLLVLHKVKVQCFVHPSGVLRCTFGRALTVNSLGLILGYVLHVLQIPASKVASAQVVIPKHFNPIQVCEQATAAINRIRASQR